MAEVSASELITSTNKGSPYATSDTVIVGGDIQAKVLASCNRSSQILLAVFNVSQLSRIKGAVSISLWVSCIALAALFPW